MLQFEIEAAVAALPGWQVFTAGGSLNAKRTLAGAGEVCVQANTAEFLAMQAIAIESQYGDRRPHHPDQEAGKRPAPSRPAARVAA
jgi:hypothetical protein